MHEQVANGDDRYCRVERRGVGPRDEGRYAKGRHVRAAIGCVLAEVLLGFPLFRTIDTKTSTGVLASHVALLGPLPNAMCKAAPLADVYLSKAGIPLVVNPLGERPGVFEVVPRAEDPRVPKMLREVIDDDNYIQFILFMLELDPAERPDARTLLSASPFRAGPKTAVPPPGTRVRSFSS